MAKTSPKKNSGFEEAPQAEFEGAPLSGSISDWADEIAREAEKQPKAKKKSAARSKDASRTSRGTSMGGAASAKERAAAGLNPVAGMDVALEDAEKLSSSGVTATVAALSRLIVLQGKDMAPQAVLYEAAAILLLAGAALIMLRIRVNRKGEIQAGG